MGASFNYIIYECDDKQTIQNSWIDDQYEAEQEYIVDYICENFDEDDEDYDYDEALEEAQESTIYSGEVNAIPADINWINKTFDNEQDAIEYMEKHHEKWENPLGIPFKNGKKINYAVGGWCSD